MNNLPQIYIAYLLASSSMQLASLYWQRVTHIASLIPHLRRNITLENEVYRIRIRTAHFSVCILKVYKPLSLEWISRCNKAIQRCLKPWGSRQQQTWSDESLQPQHATRHQQPTSQLGSQQQPQGSQEGPVGSQGGKLSCSSACTSRFFFAWMWFHGPERDCEGGPEKNWLPWQGRHHHLG